MVSQGTKERWAHYNPSTDSWDEFVQSGVTIPLMEARIPTTTPRALKGPAEKQLGVVVPLFPPPMDDSGFTQAAAILKKHPAIDAYIVVDSDTIKFPGIAADKKLINWIRFLKANGAKVLGKVNTSFGVHNINQITAFVDRWKANYSDIDGIFFANAGQGSRLATEYYKPLVEYTKKQAGYQYVVGSIGTSHEIINTTPENVEALVRDVGFDITILYEGKNFPEPVNFAQGWMQKYPRNKMGIIITGVDADENVQKMQDFIMRLVGTYKAVGYVYVNSDSGARVDNPYMALSSLFDVQLQTMDMLAESEGNTRTRALAQATQQQQPQQPIAQSRGDIREEDVEGSVPQDGGDIREEDVPAVKPPIDLEKDMNGIRKVYPDAIQHFQEWFFNERDPTKDPRFKDWENTNLRRMQDGSDSWYVDGGSKGQVRIAGWSKPGTYWADATEMTIYVKWLNDDTKLPSGRSRGRYAYQIYLRGGDHSNQKGRGGEASCYKFRMGTDGQTYLVKEIQHSPPGYTNNVSGRKISTPKGTVKGQWVGMKLVVYNIQEKDDGPVWVMVEGWVDSTCTDNKKKDGSLDTSKQKWVKVVEHIDKGGWKCSSMKRAVKLPSVDYNSKTPDYRQPTEIISKPGGTKDGNLGAFRMDYRAAAFKYFCIRQIENPSHAD